MLNVEVDNVRDLRAALCLDGLRAEERGKGEDEERERYPAEHGGGRRERDGEVRVPRGAHLHKGNEFQSPKYV